MPRSADTHCLRCRLLHRIGQRYQTVTQTVRIGSIQFDFTRIADPDRVLDQVAAEEDRLDRLAGRPRDENELHLPYWAELWDSAYGLAHFLIAAPADCLPQPSPAGKNRATSATSPDRPAAASQPLAGLSVLDLGCGMGLAGTTAAALGASVLFADLEPPALLFAALNSLPFRPRVRTRQLNWRTDSLPQRFDLILGADILYERAQWPYLEPFWRRHLAPRGLVLLGEPGRQTGDLFPAWLANHPWKLDRRQHPVSTRPQPIRIFALTRSVPG